MTSALGIIAKVLTKPTLQVRKEDFAVGPTIMASSLVAMVVILGTVVYGLDGTRRDLSLAIQELDSQLQSTPPDPVHVLELTERRDQQLRGLRKEVNRLAGLYWKPIVMSIGLFCLYAWVKEWGYEDPSANPPKLKPGKGIATPLAVGVVYQVLVIRAFVG